MLIYKVVELRYSGNVKARVLADVLERKINEHAFQNWNFDKVISSEAFALIGPRDVFFLIFKKEVEIPENLFININGQNVVVDKYNVHSLTEKGLFQPGTMACVKGMSEWKPVSVLARDLIDALFQR